MDTLFKVRLTEWLEANLVPCNVCAAEGCEVEVTAKGLCKRHYYAARRLEQGSKPRGEINTSWVADEHGKRVRRSRVSCAEHPCVACGTTEGLIHAKDMCRGCYWKVRYRSNWREINDRNNAAAMTKRREAGIPEKKKRVHRDEKGLNAEVFTDLYHGEHRKIAGRLRWKGIQEDDIDDLIQDVFADLWALPYEERGQLVRLLNTMVTLRIRRYWAERADTVLLPEQLGERLRQPTYSREAYLDRVERRICSKVKYKTEQHAFAAGRAQPSRALLPYLCPIDGWWHLTSAEAPSEHNIAESWVA